jgi:hypothetical protein
MLGHDQKAGRAAGHAPAVWLAGLVRVLAVLSAMVATGSAPVAMPPQNPSEAQPPIKREPAYKSAPKYALLGFGTEPRARTWVVLDGETLHVDTSCSGDLTLARVGTYGDAFAIADGQGTKYRLMFGRASGGLYVRVGIAAKYVESTIVPLTERPKDAVVCLFHQTLQFWVLPEKKTERVLTRGERPAEIHAYIGTANDKLPTKWVTASLAEGFYSKICPVATITFTGRDPGQNPTSLKVPLSERRGDAFCGEIPVPSDAGEGKATVTISLDGWSQPVKPLSFEMPIVDWSPKTGLLRTRCLDGRYSPVDLSKVDRAIKKEPAYRSKPQYCLLLFGRQAETRIWLVLDGDVLFVDTNADGDLTEPGKKFTIQSRAVRVPEIIERDGKTRHKNLQVTFRSSVLGNGLLFHYIAVDVSGRSREYSFIESTAGSQQDAIIRHFNGPLKMDILSGIFFRNSPSRDFTAVISTRYESGEWIFVDNRQGVPADVHPSAAIDFPNKNPKRPPIHVEVPLTQRC